MDTLDLDIARSLRGSAARDGIFLAAVDRKRAYLAQLAKDADVDLRTARGAIFGEPPRFALDLSLATLGLLKPMNAEGTELETTPLAAQSATIRRAHPDRRSL